MLLGHDHAPIYVILLSLSKRILLFILTLLTTDTITSLFFFHTHTS